MSLPAAITQAELPAVPEITDAELARIWLGRLADNTRRAYSRDLDYFARHIGVASSAEAARSLVAGGAGAANRWAFSWHAAMDAAGLSPATIARRLAALRSVVACAASIGLTNWTITVRSPKVVSYRDTAGPGRQGWHRCRIAAEQRKDPKGFRDLAILRLIHDLGGRRNELVTLDLEHVDLEAPAVWVLGKGYKDRTKLTLPPQTRKALEGWLAVRGSWAGPLFTSMDRPDSRSRLTGRGLAKMTRALGLKAGVKRGTNPHGFRHAAITEALDRTGGDVRKVQRFSRHVVVQTLIGYDDRRKDQSGDVARLIADDAW
jgi:integrase/recombinase XerC